MSRTYNPIRLLLLIVIVVVTADQATKIWASNVLPGEPVSLLGSFLELEYAENTGAAFSLFQGRGSLIGVLAVLAVVLIVRTVVTLDRTSEVVGLSLIAAGAIGNLIDRIVRGDGFLDGFVVDFVSLWRIPNFNVADAAITVGATILIAVALFARHPEP